MVNRGIIKICLVSQFRSSYTTSLGSHKSVLVLDYACTRNRCHWELRLKAFYQELFDLLISGKSEKLLFYTVS